MRRVWLIISIVIIALLNGCGFDYTGAVSEEEVYITKLNYTPDFNYIKVPQTPSLITDRLGYEPAGKKVVFLRTDNTDADYSIIDMSTNEVVYEGIMTKMDITGNESTHLYTGDFSDFSTEGTYRILQEDVGYSYPFDIKKNIYKNLNMDIYNRVATAKYTKTSDLIYVLANLMMTKDIYSDSYINETFIRNSIERLLKSQDAGTGAVYDLLTVSEELDGEESLTSTAEFAGVMAQFYQLHKEEPDELVLASLQAALRAYQYMDSYRDNVSADSYYYASAAMYRATGQIKYRNAIALYDQMEHEAKQLSQYDFVMLADVAYLKSEYKVDYNRCEQIMTDYLNDMVRLSALTDKQHFYVQSNIDELSENDIICNMMKLGLVGYVVSGHEYASIQGNYIHYLLGVNGNKRDYMLEGMGDTPIGENILELSRLIFVLGSKCEL